MNDPLAGLRCLAIGAASGIGRATVGLLKDRVRGMVAADRPDAHWDAADPHRVGIDVTDAGSVENDSRPVAMASESRSGRPGSKNGASPRWSASILAVSTSKPVTSWPSVAMQAAWTVPR